MRRSLLFLAFIASLLMVGCSGINSSNDGGGGISLRLPESSIRSVYSEGLISDPEGGSVANYVVRVRRDGNVEAEESASPGSTITIDGLLPGQYTVAVLGVNSSGLVTYYGRSSEVTVSPREISAASVSMQNVEGILVSVSCSWVDDDGNWNSGIVPGIMLLLLSRLLDWERIFPIQHRQV